MLAKRYSATRSSALTLAATTGSLRQNVKSVHILPKIPPLPEKPICEEASQTPSAPKPGDEPISDPDLPFPVQISTARDTDEADLDVDLNIPPLPPTVNHPDFMSIFERKCELCTKAVEFPNTDKGHKIEQVVRDTATEFLELYGRVQGVREMKESCHKLILGVISANVFRPRLGIDTRLLTGEEAPKLPSRDLTIFEKYCQLLQRMLSVCGTESLFEPHFHVEMMKALGSPDVNEHIFVLQGLMQYYVAFPKRRNDVVNTACNMFCEYLEGLRTPFCVWPLLSFFAKILRALVPSVPPKWMDLMRWTVLPLAKGEHLSWYGEPLATVLNVLCVVDPDLLVECLEYLIKHWPETRGSKQRVYLEVITNLAEQLTLKPFVTVLKPLFSLYAKCSNSENARLCETAYKIWGSPKLVVLIVERAKLVFPIVYSEIAEASRNHWNPQVKTAAFTVLKKMHEIDPFIYNELNTKHIRGIPQKMRMSQQKNWAIITRIAGKMDPEIPVPEKLSQVQVIFNCEKPAVTMSTGTNRTNERMVMSPVNPIRKTTVWR